LSEGHGLCRLSEKRERGDIGNVPLKMMRMGILMQPHNYSEGFTLVELSIAIVATAIVMLTAGMMLQSMVRAIQRQAEMANLQGDMRVVAPTLMELAREARSVDVTSPMIGATGVVFTVGTNSIYRANISWVADAAGPNLVYARGAGAGNRMLLSKGWIKTFSVSRSTNSTSFEIEMNNTNDSIEFSCDAFSRN
jgi:prepilin-type N-terminal cleavage/methylation domain-containing protein